ncbi:hypothetical protein QJS04_geneDACA022279 [Acorus gramineus]|uniref:Uncharacterized protein n=1 Tax=Acorus gramineus TaxID=55184 RepID=A0AAV9B8J0_ACOGR|nr:hypothetical protein QJS04_geneDACA022279 [Acorus gramineus]
MVRGTISILHRPAYVMFDSGSTHSFVASDFARGFGVEPASLSFLLEVVFLLELYTMDAL